MPTMFETMEYEQAVVLVVAWLLGWGAFHVASGLIHLPLIVAVITIVFHFVRRGGATG